MLDFESREVVFFRCTNEIPGGATCGKENQIELDRVFAGNVTCEGRCGKTLNIQGDYPKTFSFFKAMYHEASKGNWPVDAQKLEDSLK